MEQFLKIHESPDDFRLALNSSTIETGFSERLIEKDYYCSLVLADLRPLFDHHGLVFKGGTCLSKVHAAFYRLSEDLDFAISASVTARRAERRQIIGPIKEHLEKLPLRIPALDLTRQLILQRTLSTGTQYLVVALPQRPQDGHRVRLKCAGVLSGNDQNRQYNGVLQYGSIITGENETLKVQVAIREPIVDATIFLNARTLIRHPLSDRETPHDELLLRVMSLAETYAEKVRAALTRQPPAIRDIFDLDHAVCSLRIDLFELKFLELVRCKLSVPGNGAIDASPARIEMLANQLETHLKPVLRGRDFAEFKIDRALSLIERLAACLLEG